MALVGDVPQEVRPLPEDHVVALLPGQVHVRAQFKSGSCPLQTQGREVPPHVEEGDVPAWKARSKVSGQGCPERSISGRQRLRQVGDRAPGLDAGR